MSKSDKVLLILATFLAVLFVLIIAIFLINLDSLINDYHCSNLPIDEFFKDERCKEYWHIYE